MTDSTPKRTIKVALALNTVFWLAFWTFFVGSSATAPRPLSEHQFRLDQAHSLYISVFGRALPEGLPNPVKSIVGTVQFPSLFLAYLFGRLLPGDIVLAETNHPGLKLLGTTAFSYGQWYVLALLISMLWRRSRARSQPAST